MVMRSSACGYGSGWLAKKWREIVGLCNQEAGIDGSYIPELPGTTRPVCYNPDSMSETSQATQCLVSDSTKQKNNRLVRALNQEPLRLQEELGSQTMGHGKAQKIKKIPRHGLVQASVLLPSSSARCETTQRIG